MDILKKANFSLNAVDDNNHTALIIAIEREDSKMVEHLLSYYKKNTKTLDVNHKDSEQMTGELRYAKRSLMS